MSLLSSKDMSVLVDAVTAMTSQPVFPWNNTDASSNYVGMSKRTLANNSSNNETAPRLKRKHHDGPSFSVSSRKSMDNKERFESRTRRLELRRLAAIESRRQKKIMEEELKHSVMFYSKANASLKSQNKELQRQIILTKQKVLAIRENNKSEETRPGSTVKDDANTHLEKNNIASICTEFEGPKSFATTDNVSDFSSLLKPISTPKDAEHAQKGRFTATQALNMTLDFPPGASREAASTVSRDTTLTGTKPYISSRRCKHSKTIVTDATGSLHSAKAATRKKSIAEHCEEKSLEQVAANESSMAYIEALNRVSMYVPIDFLYIFITYCLIQFFCGSVCSCSSNGSDPGREFSQTVHNEWKLISSNVFVSLYVCRSSALAVSLCSSHSTTER